MTMTVMDRARREQKRKRLTDERAGRVMEAELRKPDGLYVEQKGDMVGVFGRDKGKHLSLLREVPLKKPRPQTL